MPVARHLAAVVEVVEDAELPGQFMFVRRNLLAIHHQRRIAIALRNVAKDLIVSAVFLDDVDDVMNRIIAVLEADLSRAVRQPITANDFGRKLLSVAFRLHPVHSRNGAVEQRCDVADAGLCPPACLDPPV